MADATKKTKATRAGAGAAKRTARTKAAKGRTSAPRRVAARRGTARVTEKRSAKTAGAKSRPARAKAVKSSPAAKAKSKAGTTQVRKATKTAKPAKTAATARRATKLGAAAKKANVKAKRDTTKPAARATAKRSPAARASKASTAAKSARANKTAARASGKAKTVKTTAKRTVKKSGAAGKSAAKARPSARGTARPSTAKKSKAPARSRKAGAASSSRTAAKARDRQRRRVQIVEREPEPKAPPLALTLPAPGLASTWTPEQGRPYPFYLEFVVTEQCNLRCVYCMDLAGIAPPAPEAEARYDEMLAMARVCAERGIAHAWVTGGEPLGRKGIFQFLTDLAKVSGLRGIHLSTNGILLKEALPSLERSGVTHLHVHLDSLRSLPYHKVTKQDWLYRVQEGLAAAEDAGFTRIGLHVTVVRGFNEEELVDFAMLTKMGPYQVRFAEVLPRTITDEADRLRYLVPREEIFARVEAFEHLHRVEVDDGVPGVDYYRFHDGIGEIVFLGPSGDCVTAAGPRLRVGPTGDIVDSVGGFAGNLKQILAEGGPAKLAERLEELAGLRRPEVEAKAP